MLWTGCEIWGMISHCCFLPGKWGQGQPSLSGLLRNLNGTTWRVEVTHICGWAYTSPLLAYPGILSRASPKGAVCFGCSRMEHPRGLKKPLSQRRARSLDRVQDPRKDSESRDCQSLSLPATLSKRVRPWMASDGSRCPESPAQSEEAQGTPGTALSLEQTTEFLPREQRPPQDTKKDKAQKRAQQGWLKSVLNFFLRTGAEEAKEKASRRAKGKEGVPQPAETSEPRGDPAPRKKAHGKKASRKKHSHKKHVDEETEGAQDQEAEGHEAALPKTPAALHSTEADRGPAPRGEQTMPISMVTPLPHPQGLGHSKLAPQTSQQRQCGRWDSYQGQLSRATAL